MDKEVIKQIADQVLKGVDESISDVVGTVVEEKTKGFADQFKDIKEQIKSLGLEGKIFKAKGDEKELGQKMVVDIFKHVAKGIPLETAEKEVKAAYLNESTAGEGAEFVFTQFLRDIQMEMSTYDVIGLCRQITLVNGETLRIPKSTNTTSTAWVSEGSSTGKSKPTTSVVEISVKIAQTLVDFTENMLDDSMTTPELYSYIVQNVAESQAGFKENQILNGDGTGNNMDGVFHNSSVLVIQMAAGETVDDIADKYLVQMITKAAIKFKKNKKNIAWIGSQYVYGKLLNLRTTTGAWLYPELRDFNNPSLLGYKFIISEKSPIQDVAEDIAETKFLAFGDMKYFAVVTRKDLTVKQGYNGDGFSNGIITLRGEQRIGGKFIFPEAIVVLETGETV